MLTVKLILTISVIESTTAVSISKNVLAKPNEDTLMVCPFQVTSTPVIWFGPQNGKLVTYVDGENVNRDISHFDRICLVGNKSNGEYNLEILNVTTKDSGVYKCHTIQNGSSFQAVFYLTILEIPRTHDKKRIFDFQTKIGKPATIIVPVISGQEPQVAWTRNEGGRLGTWRATESGTSRFILMSTISPLTREHFGIYSIRVRNEVGSTLLQLNLKLIDSNVSIVTIQPTNANCNASSEVNLSCQLHASDVRGWHNHWIHSRNDQFIKTVIGSVNGNRSSIEVKFCDYREEGNYICTWKDSQNHYSASATIRSSGPPTLTNTSVFLKDAKQVCMSVSFYSSDTSVTSKWYRNDKAVRPSVGNQMHMLPSTITLNYSGKYIKENGNTSTLCMSNFTFFDVLPFSCEITNIIGRIENIFQDNLINQSYQQLIIEKAKTQQEANENQEEQIFWESGSPFKFASTIGCVFIVVVAVIVITSARKCYKKKEVVLQENIRPSIEMSNAAPFPESGYEEIETIPMTDFDIATDEQSMIYEDDSVETTPSDLENPSGISFEHHDYQDIDESKFEVHTYTQCKKLY